jgi:ATP-dependent exoDNAse (exonuclease V) beta subunit
MTAHKAKGLEFPVVVLADITAELSRASASRWIDGATGRFAVSLAGWSPADLLDHEATESARDAAEGVRVAYVAATRARDLLVVPAIGDQPFETGWVSPLNEAIYPALDARREVTAAPWTAHFAGDSVLDRETSTPYSNVRPGVHVVTGAGSDGATVTWWDPGALDLGRQPSYGLRREELIAKDAPAGVVDAGRQRFLDWQAAHHRTIEEGSRPGLRVLTVRASAAQPAEPEEDLPAVRVEQLKPRGGYARPSGPRFGALVHAVLAFAPLDAGAGAVGDIARQHARLLDATEAEVSSAIALVSDVLTHDLLARARDAGRRGRVRREVPVTMARASGVLVEGVVDLAFEEDARWTVVDFKTDYELGPSLETYVRQVQIYAAAIARATGRPAAGVLLRI